MNTRGTGKTENMRRRDIWYSGDIGHLEGVAIAMLPVRDTILN